MSERANIAVVGTETCVRRRSPRRVRRADGGKNNDQKTLMGHVHDYTRTTAKSGRETTTEMG